MTTDWLSLIFDTSSPRQTWEMIFDVLLNIAQEKFSPVTLHDRTVFPDRLLAEAAWELWESYPIEARLTSVEIKNWCNDTFSSGKAILILDALSLRELPLILAGAQERNITPLNIRVTGSECPSTTDQFARALGISSRSALTDHSKAGIFNFFADDVYADVLSLPFEDCNVPPMPNLFIWHTWLDDLIHLKKKLPDQIAKISSTVLLNDGFWDFVNKMRQGRKLIITSDHGYAISGRFSTEVNDPHAVEILREFLGASRTKLSSEKWQECFMPPTVMHYNNHYVVMGQKKWKVRGGFPYVCHGGMSLLEVAVPWIELEAI